MKKIHIFMLTAAAAAAFVSCVKEATTPEEEVSPSRKTITVYTDVQTKTTLDVSHENIVWSTGDKISIFNDRNNDNDPLTYEAAGYMTIDVPATTTEIYGHYPYYSNNTSGPTSVSIYISNSQTQKNPGELNGTYYPMVAKGTVTADNKANLQFYPVASALAINLYHTGLVGTETVSKVKVTPTSNTEFYGSQTTDITGNNIKYTSAASSNPITVTLTNALTLGSTQPANSQTFDGQIYVCLAKQSYTAVTFEITTNKGVYTITSNSTAFDCVNNDFVPVNINLNKAAFVANLAEPSAKTGWYRVEDASWLAAGDRVAIVANGYDRAASSADAGNNRVEVNVTKSTDDGYTKMTFDTAVQEFILETGTKSGSFGFWCDNGAKPNYYIYAASSSSNHMKSQTTLDDNASFTVSVAGGVATVTAQGTYTHNIIRYNDSSKLFSCYASGQKDIAIYKYYGGSTPTCATPTISLSDATVTITSTGGASIYYTTDGSTPTDASTEYTAPFSIDGTVTVKALAVRNHYNNSEIASKECVPSITCATPVITGTGISFTITCATEGATIYYETSTTNLASVSTPSTSSSVYSSAVAINATTYVKAYAVKTGCTDSAVASATCEYSTGTPNTYTSTFSSKYWDIADGSDFSWTSGKDGAGFSNNGIQVTTNASGAYGTTNKVFGSVSQVVVTYNTNTSNGAGTLTLKIGSNEEQSEDWAYSTGDGKTANYTCTFTVSPTESGAIKLTANTKTNSIYIVSVAVTALSMSDPE